MRSLGRVGAVALAIAATTSLAVALGGAGCVVTTVDSIDSGPVQNPPPPPPPPEDTGVPLPDTYVPPTDTYVPPTDSYVPPVDTGVTDTGVPSTGGVIVKAQSLISNGADPLLAKDFGGGSTSTQINSGVLSHARIVYNNEFKGDLIYKSATGYVDTRVTGFPAGQPITFEVQGFLYGRNCHGAECRTKDTDPTTMPDFHGVEWGKTTCTATPVATGDVVATCTPIKFGGFAQLLFSSAELLPSGYCQGKGATDFDKFRVIGRNTDSGEVVVNAFTPECGGVVQVLQDDFVDLENANISFWEISLERKSSTTACSLTKPCQVNRSSDLFVVFKGVSDSCLVNAASTGEASCF